MPIIKTITNFSLLIITMSLLSCSGQRPTNLGISDGKFTTCPSSPNCVSSDAGDDRHKTLPFKFNVTANAAWHMARETLLKLPRTKIVTETPDYLHAECTSTVFGFVDDLELHLRPTAKIIAIRSASRLGHSDLGVNRARIEALRDLLIKQGINKI